MISLYDILEAGNGQPFGEPGAEIFTDFSFDSRTAVESSLYVALKTDAGDGHQYIAEAVQNGATGVLWTRPPDIDTTGLSVILVKDPYAALMMWSSYILKKFAPQVIAVTGSSGKSVTVAAISHVLQTRHSVLRSVDVAGGRLTLPMTLAKLNGEHQIVVLELAPSQPGDLAGMVQSVKPEVGVITRIGTPHRSEAAHALADEDALLIERLPETGLAVLNYDDDRTRTMNERTKAKALTIGLEGFGADVTAYNVVLGATGTGFDVRVGETRLVGRWSPLLGNHQLYAVLAAVAVGTHYDIPPADALKALTMMTPLPGRMNPLNGIGGALLVDDSYGADPETTLAALDWLHAVTDQHHRTIFIFGDMDELGDYNQRGHRAVGQKAAETVDLFITVGKDAAYAARAAIDQGMATDRVRATYSMHDAVAQLKEPGALTSDDIVLIKGGAASRTEMIAHALLADEADANLLPRASHYTELDMLLRPMRSSWVDIDLDALAENVRGLKALVGDSVTLMAVVKANAYGHGAIPVARTALFNGAEYLAVASITEALELRSAGIDAPILVMSYTPMQAIRQAVRENITITVYDPELARAYDSAAREAGGRLLVHVKVDTGMGRMGVLASDAMPLFRSLLSLSHLEVEGIYTHFAQADESLAFTLAQVETFRQVLKPLQATGFSFKYIHAANSAGTLISNETHFNAVRVGLAMYGLSPSELAQVPPNFKPVLSWKTVIAQVKTLPPGHPVGYGSTYQASENDRIAVIPVGYSDGLRRAPQYWGHVLVRGNVAPIVGRVSMEKTTINVTHIPGVSVGDEVVLIGTQEGMTVSIDDIARRLGTISYEILCGIVPRAPRV
ncbi:MAG: alanine racemase [Anaerolineae bacterium]|nr:alanine racemase [Anaerolineae bacterium]